MLCVFLVSWKSPLEVALSLPVCILVMDASLMESSGFLVEEFLWETVQEDLAGQVGSGISLVGGAAMQTGCRVRTLPVKMRASHNPFSEAEKTPGKASVCVCAQCVYSWACVCTQVFTAFGPFARDGITLMAALIS